MLVRSCGFKNGGTIMTHDMADNATLGDLAGSLEINAGHCSFSVNGQPAEVNHILMAGDMVSYTQRQIKGA